MNMIAELDNVSVSLDKTQILKQLNWQIPKGKTIGLLGKNGAGKSTLIRTLLGLILPDDGNATIFGVNARSIGDKEKEKLAYVPQTAMGYEGLKVKAALQLHASCYSQWDHVLEQRMIQQFDMPLNSKVVSLSTGQRQALMLIFALPCKPQLLLMDEPVASLDPSARRDVLQFISEASSEQCSIVYSTHITADLTRLADQVAMLDDGKIQFHRSTEDIANSVLIQGPLNPDMTHKLKHQNNILKNTDGESLVCSWDEALETDLNKENIVQRLNLEEFFIRWHQMKIRSN